MSKCLFVLQSAEVGGTSTSLLNLLSLYAEKGIKHDVFLFFHDGMFVPEIKEVSNLLPEDKLLAAASCEKANLKKRGLLAFLRRGYVSLRYKIFGAKKTRVWLYKKCAKRLSGKYDTVIAYQEDLTTDFVQYVICKNKIAWCHANMDYDSISRISGGSLESLREKYLKFDKILCVSEKIKSGMLEKLSLPEKSLFVIYNTIPRNLILRKANADTQDLIEKRTFTFVSVGRFHAVKRFDRVVSAAKALDERGVDFIWYMVGDGDKFYTIKKMVDDMQLSSKVILVGAKFNPLVYVKQADCLVMSSENEGQPMVLNEALTLGVPVIITDFSSAREIVGEENYGLIVPNSDQGFVNGILHFWENTELRQKMKKAAGSFLYDNDSIIAKIDELI